MTEQRLKEIEFRARPGFDPPREDVHDLIAEVRRLRRVNAELQAEFDAISANARHAERERCAQEVRAFNDGRFSGGNSLLTEIESAIREDV